MDEDLAAKSVEILSAKGAQYADSRLEDHYVELISVINGNVQRGLINRKRGIGIRALVDGSWGFRSTTDLSKNGIGEAANVAYKLANSSSRHSSIPSRLASMKAHERSYAVKMRTDLENVPFEDKLDSVVSWEKSLHTSKLVKRGLADYTGLKIRKIFVNSEGTLIRFTNSVSWLDLKAECKQSATIQSYERTLGHTGGYELYEKNDVQAISSEIGKKAEDLLRAKPAKTEKNASVILKSDYAALVAHEICGHPSEADRVLGREAAWAGTTWWKGRLGKRVGSDLLTVYDDPTIEGTLGYFLFDDEGVEAKRKALIENGVLKNHMHSRETAALFNTVPNAGMRAITFEYVPLIRMSNTFFGEGDWKLDELIMDVKHGYMVSMMRTPSIDDKRYNWTISAQEAYEIKNGELGTHLRDVALTSTAPDFFRSIDAATDKVEIHPLPGCGKGDPMQALYVGNGGPHIRATATVLGET